MKIIGKTDAGFILDVTYDEIAHIKGEYCGQYNKEIVNLNIGDSIDIDKMYDRIHTLDILDNEVEKLYDTINHYYDVREKLYKNED